MSDSALTPKRANDDLRPPDKNNPLQDVLKHTPMLRKLFGKDQAWLLLLAALPLPLIAFSPNYLAVLAWSGMILTAWLAGKAFKLFEESETPAEPGEKP
jgi:hypothetical protein